MLLFQSNHHAAPRHKNIFEPATALNEANNYTIVDREEIRKRLGHLLSKHILLSIKVPGKFAASTLLTTIARIEEDHIFLGGFQNERFNKDLLTQTTLVASADFEGIAVSFILSDLSGHSEDAVFNFKARIPQSIKWVQRRNARRVKVPINIPVKIQYKNQAEYFNVADISVTGLSYIYQAEDHYPAPNAECNIVLPDKSVFQACFEIVSTRTITYKHSKQINRVGCELKRPSYRLDTALQHLINQIDFYYQ